MESKSKAVHLMDLIQEISQDESKGKSSVHWELSPGEKVVLSKRTKKNTQQYLEDTLYQQLYWQGAKNITVGKVKEIIKGIMSGVEGKFLKMQQSRGRPSASKGREVYASVSFPSLLRNAVVFMPPNSVISSS